MNDAFTYLKSKTRLMKYTFPSFCKDKCGSGESGHRLLPSVRTSVPNSRRKCALSWGGEATCLSRDRVNFHIRQGYCLFPFVLARHHRVNRANVVRHCILAGDGSYIRRQGAQSVHHPVLTDELDALTSRFLHLNLRSSSSASSFSASASSHLIAHESLYQNNIYCVSPE
jgi:hypothetical protein